MTGALVVSVAKRPAGAGTGRGGADRFHRRLRLDRPARVALGLGAAGVAYRLVLLLLGVPGSNSDEATFGLAALHIAAGRELPVFLYGQRYMGTLESYLAAGLFALFGPSWPLLRLPLLPLYASFLYLMYRLTRRIYSPWLAVCTVGLLTLGSERVIRDQLTAVGGRPEIKPAVVGLLLLALWLGRRQGRRRWLGFAAFGLLAGVCLWSDWLALPYLAAAGLVLLVAVGRELLGRAGGALLGGLVVGAAPLLAANLTAAAGEDTLSELLRVSGGEGGTPPLTARLHGAVLLGIPIATGVCAPDRCPPALMAWGVLYLALLVVSVALAAAGHWARQNRLAADTTDPLGPQGPRPGRTGPDPLRHVARGALAGAAILTVVGYARSPVAAQDPLSSARYLSILQISLPAVLWPLWLVARTGFADTRDARSGDRPATGEHPALLGLRAGSRGRRLRGVLAAATLAAVIGTAVTASAAQVAQVGAVRTEERRFRDLVETLRGAGTRHVYGEYWTCNRLTFTSREEVLCAVLDERLRPGQDRYLPYRDRVRAAPRPAFVLGAGTTADAALRTHLRDSGIPAEVTEVAGWRIYRPAVTVRPGE